MNRTISRASISAQERFINANKVYATIYLMNPKDIEDEIKSSVKRGVNIKCNFVNGEEKPLLYTRSITLSKTQFDMMKNDPLCYCKQDEKEVIVGISNEQNTLEKTSKSFNPLNVPLNNVLNQEYREARLG